MENPSSLFSPENAHFFQPLLPGFKSHIKIPVKFFSKHIKGKHEGKTVKLRSDSWQGTWKVKMEGHTLTNGWKEFVEAHDLRVGDFVVFKHERDMLFHVTAFEPSCCEVQYAQSLSHNEIGESSRKEKEVEENVKTESDLFSSDLTCFSQTVTASNLSRDFLGVPRDFARRYGLDKGRHEVVLMNEEGKSWESEVKSYKSGQVFIFGGWKSLCTENKLKVGEPFTFKLLHNAERLVFLLCSRTEAGAEARPYKRARVQRWSQESRRLKHDVRQKIAEVGEPSRRTRSCNKSTGDQGKLQHTQFCSILDHVPKVRQSIEETLTSIRLFRAKLETKEQNLEALLHEIGNY
ncbi:PREDICTED: B3 domain-containing protein REM5-like isoform X2 [Camelina sativa]|uniref:B3 domain-containing protein REM5-like isoform X2 n=1 Tax=Camelina sativa TaxID=90675 RepID=A0ABM1QMF5_CAMSA|nr:PREDICTED: B3 domain-containing protein REM5-like isoform X2 [Camelina sativa]